MTNLEQLRKHKEQNGISYEDLAIKLGVRMRSLYRWLAEEKKPSRMSMEKIRSFLESL